MILALFARLLGITPGEHASLSKKRFVGIKPRLRGTHSPTFLGAPQWSAKPALRRAGAHAYTMQSSALMHGRGTPASGTPARATRQGMVVRVRVFGFTDEGVGIPIRWQTRSRLCALARILGELPP